MVSYKDSTSRLQRWSVLFILSALPTLGWPATLRVGPGGSIQAGLATLGAGDTLLVEAGTYYECVSDHALGRPLAGTSWSNPITIRSAGGLGSVTLKALPGGQECPGGAAVIEFGVPGSRYIIVDGFIIDGLYDATSNSQGTAAAAWDVDNIRFQNIEGKHFRTIMSVNATFVEMINIYAHHTGIPVCTSPSGCSAFYIRKHDNLIDCAHVHDVPSAYGVQFTSGGGFSVSRNTIRNSTLYNNRHGIAAGSEHIIENNHVYNNTGAGILAWSGSMLRQNTVTNNREIAVLLFGSGHELTGNRVDGTIECQTGSGDGIPCTGMDLDAQQHGPGRPRPGVPPPCRRPRGPPTARRRTTFACWGLPPKLRGGSLLVSSTAACRCIDVLPLL